MPGAIDIRHPRDAIARGDSDLHLRRSSRRGYGNPILQDGGAAGDILVNIRRRGGAAGEEEEGRKENPREIIETSVHKLLQAFADAILGVRAVVPRGKTFRGSEGGGLEQRRRGEDPCVAQFLGVDVEIAITPSGIPVR